MTATEAPAELSAEAQSPVMHQALTMALSILVERIQTLSKKDHNDFFKLCKEIPNARSQDDLHRIVLAMQEILEQQTRSIKRMELPGPGWAWHRGVLHDWKGFVGLQIKSLREERGMTQAQLAEQSGLPQSHISRIERRVHSPAHATIEKIARGLGVSPSEIDPSA